MAKQPEGKLSTKIMKAWRDMGVWAWKVHGSEYQPAGIPDITGIYNGVSVWCESKMPGNKPTMIQWKRMRDIRANGGVTVVAYSVKDAVQMITHIMMNEHVTCNFDCLYSEPIDLMEKLQQ